MLLQKTWVSSCTNLLTWINLLRFCGWLRIGNSPLWHHMIIPFRVSKHHASVRVNQQHVNINHHISTSQQRQRQQRQSPRYLFFFSLFSPSTNNYLQIDYAQWNRNQTRQQPGLTRCMAATTATRAAVRLRHNDEKRGPKRRSAVGPGDSASQCMFFFPFFLFTNTYLQIDYVYRTMTGPKRQWLREQQPGRPQQQGNKTPSFLLKQSA